MAGSSAPGAGGRQRVHQRLGLPLVKTFEDLWAELSAKAEERPEGSGTVQQLDAGTGEVDVAGVASPDWGQLCPFFGVPD